jgi:hypothetical protein
VNRGAIGALWALTDFRRKEIPAQAPEKVFVLEATQLQSSRKPVAELNDAIIKERKAGFDRVGHCHPISLRAQQIL